MITHTSPETNGRHNPGGTSSAAAEASAVKTMIRSHVRRTCPQESRIRSQERASAAELKPRKLEDTMAFMFESRFAMRLTRHAMESSELQHDYFEGWQGLKRYFPGP